VFRDVFQRLVERDQDWLLLIDEFWLYAARHREHRARLATGYNWLRRTIAKLIRDHWERSGVSRVVPAEELASIVLALQTGLAQQRLLDPESVRPDAFTRAISLLVGREPPGD
jgi:hypothetical protein